MLNAVAGENGNRPFTRKPTREQRSADAPHAAEHLRVTQRLPGIVGATLREENALRRLPRPFLQRVDPCDWAIGKLLFHPHQDGAVESSFDNRRPLTEPHWPQRRATFRGDVHERFTFGPRFSRKSFSRNLASSSACAAAEISDSIANPACRPLSAMRGSTCVTAKFVTAVLPAMRCASSSP